jgi:hypothetical protein
MATLRLHLLLGTALIAATGCAQQPVRSDHIMSTTAPNTTAATAVSVHWASAFPPRLLVFAYEQGWRQVVMVGDKQYFCRADVPSGSLLTEHRCVTQSQLEFIRLMVEQQQEQLRKPIPSDRMG